MIHPGPADAVYARPRAVAHFDVTYRGVTSHAGAYPHLGRNAADAFTIAQVAIGLLRQQLAPSVRVHGIVTEAGTAPNAIPDLARGSWYVRADTLAELDGAFARVRACFEAGAMGAGCEWELTETSPRYAEFRNDERLARLFAANGAALGRDLDLAENGPRGMATASTDMGNVSQRVRAIHPYLGIASLPAVNHQPAFADATVTQAADRAVRDGAVLLAQTAIDAALADLSCSPQDQVGCPLRDQHDRDDGVHRGQGRENRGVDHAEAGDAVDAQPGVDYRARITGLAYPAGTAHVVDRLVDGPLDRGKLLVGNDPRADARRSSCWRSSSRRECGGGPDGCASCRAGSVSSGSPGRTRPRASGPRAGASVPGARARRRDPTRSAPRHGRLRPGAWRAGHPPCRRR
jgi:Peptidase dimerisation domain